MRTEHLAILGIATLCVALMGCNHRQCLESKTVYASVPYCGLYKDGYCQRTDYRYTSYKQCVKYADQL
jgi:hypothetical protein